MKKGERRAQVLAEFRKDPSITIRDLAGKLKIGVFTCYYHLSILENEGMITRNHYVGNYMGKAQKIRKTKMRPTREKVLAAFRSNPMAQLKEISRQVGVSEASVSWHLGKLEQDGIITRPRVVRDTRKQASKPNEKSKAWASVNQKGAISRGEGAMRGRRGSGEDALQERIDAVVAKAEKGGTCFRADFVRLDNLGGCKCG